MTNNIDFRSYGYIFRQTSPTTKFVEVWYAGRIVALANLELVNQLITPSDNCIVLYYLSMLAGEMDTEKIIHECRTVFYQRKVIPILYHHALPVMSVKALQMKIEFPSAI